MNKELIEEIGNIISSLERVVKILEDTSAESEPIEEIIQEIGDGHEEITEKEVSQLLKKLSVSANLLGYKFLRSAILICIKNPGALYAITKELYPEVAKENKTTSTKVERAIRNAIEVSFDRIDANVYMEIFQYTVSPKKGKPTNSEYIAAVVDYLKIR